MNKARKLLVTIFIFSNFLSVPFIYAQSTYPSEVRLLNAFNPNSPNSYTPFNNFISNTVYPLIFVPSAVYATKYLIQKDPQFKYQCLQSMVNIGINTLITSTLKESIQRNRPYVQYPNFIVNHSPSGDKSFPSGHTSFAFALATELSIEYKKWYVIAPAYLYASAVGQSRMHLGVHYPTDVLVGALVGTASAFTSRYLMNKISTKKVRKRLN